ncbi:MAG: GNAT family N-acetyltransferase [Cytophagales bacterium]|nr:GNAT family N-acetyltransferase [Cytophagales bacterium]
MEKEALLQLRLRKLSIDDTYRLALLANNKKIADNLKNNFPHPYDANDAEFFIGNCLEEETPVTFAIEWNYELVGCIGIIPQEDIYEHSAEIGYWVGEPYWNMGIASKALRIMMEYAFFKLRYTRLFAHVIEYNTASCHVLKKSGFTLEGIGKKAVLKNNRLWDEYRYGLLAPASYI